MVNRVFDWLHMSVCKLICPRAHTQLDACRSAAIRLVCRMTEADMVPISVVEGKEFKELVWYLELEYVLPSRE